MSLPGLEGLIASPLIKSSSQLSGMKGQQAPCGASSRVTHCRLSTKTLIFVLLEKHASRLEATVAQLHLLLLLLLVLPLYHESLGSAIAINQVVQKWGLTNQLHEHL